MHRFIADENIPSRVVRGLRDGAAGHLKKLGLNAVL